MNVMGVNVGVVNVNSLRNKVTYVQDLISSVGLSALGVCETWLTGDTPSSYVDLVGFNLFRRDVVGSIRKHGVGLYVSKTLSAVSDEVDVANVLSVFVKSWDLHIVVCYRPPSYTTSENDALISFLSEFSVSRKVLVMGDFNLPSLKWPIDGLEVGYISPLDQSFYDLFLILGLNQLVHGPTYVPSGNVLDLIFTSEVESFGEVSILSPLPNCYHCPVVIELFVRPVLAVHKRIRLWFRGNYRSISEELYVIDWESEFEWKSVNDCFELFLVFVENHLSS